MINLGIPERNHFGELLNSRNLLGEAVEVGTHRGEFACNLLSSWTGAKLYCVDPWLPGYDRMDPASHGDREQDYQIFSESCSQFSSRITVLRALSKEAVLRFPNNLLDFAYVDGNHQPEHVRHDVYEWYKKIKSGGIMAGHDFLCPGEINGGWGQFIQPIVIEFCNVNNLDLYLVPEPAAMPWSWYVFKP